MRVADLAWVLAAVASGLSVLASGGSPPARVVGAPRALLGPSPSPLPEPRAAGRGAPGESPLLGEVQRAFPPTKKWFGMVADLTWEASAAGALTPRYETLRSPSVLARDAAGQRLFVSLPPLASGAHLVWVEHDPALSVRTQELGALAVEAELHGGVVVYRGAVAGGDLLYKLTPTHVDEYLYLREPPATLRREFEFDLGPGVAGLRQAGRVVELLGKDGAAHLRLSAPFARAADGIRRNGTVRVEGTRLVEELDLSGLAAPILVDPDWSTTGTMTVAHWADFAYRLPDATVMAVGGCALASCPLGLASSACSQVLASTDLWHPSSGTWTAGPVLLTARYSFAGVVLGSGDLLVAGGCTATGCQATTDAAERFSAAQNTWVPVGELPMPLANATGALLPNGDALVAGGCDESGCFADVARFVVASNAWQPLDPMSGPRGFATTTALADGRVLVAGGCADAACATVLAGAEVYDPATDSWSFAGGMATPRAGHTATLLDDGTVLIAGGCSEASCKGTALGSAEVWSEAAPGGAFVGVSPMSAPRHHHTATRLQNGEVLLAGGTDAADSTHAASEVYMPVGAHFIQTPLMKMSRAYHTAVELASGDVLVAGGCNGATCLPWAEVFSPVGLPVETPDGGLVDGGPPIGPPDAGFDAGEPVAVVGGPHPKLFRTGVFSCGVDTVQNLPCPIAGYPLQDGEFQPNLHPLQAGDAEVVDPVTGLVWQTRDDKQVYTQSEAVAACAALPASDGAPWRLPNVVELVTINHYGKIGPSTDQAFVDTQQTNYWTQTAVAGSLLLGWTVKFDAGEVVPLLSDTPLPIRCVRGELAQVGGHLRLAGPLTPGEQTVRDEANELEWQRRDDGVRRSWRESLDYCAGLTLDGKDDWHLPNVLELLSLLEFGSAEPVKLDPAFQDGKGDLYWTSTFNEGIPTLSWSISFNLGVVDGVTTSGQALARCVRHVMPEAQPTPSGCGCFVGAETARAPWAAAALVVAAWLRRRAARRQPPSRRWRAGALGAAALLVGCAGTPHEGGDCAQDGSCAEGLVCFADWRCYRPDAQPSCDPPCYGELPFCDTSSLRCVACASDADCGPGTLCEEWLGRCQPGCSAEHPACAEAATTCDVALGLCVGCASDSDCTDGARPRCDESTGTCVACLSSPDDCPLGSRCSDEGGAPACVPGCKDDGDCAGGACCAHVCVDLATDHGNCGGCGLPCGATATCCDATCTSLDDDPFHCGGCGTSCLLPNVQEITCAAGVCGHGDCESFFQNCDDDFSNGCEVNLTSDPDNCYGCGVACAPLAHAEPACTVAGCTLGPCLAGWADCNGVSADGCEYDAAGFDVDPDNCGGCGVGCAGTCQSGGCT